ncbi:23S rRNA (guanosine(2251)-2'-O)-methyltransferase RlmB [Candidatus Pantoea edessiphila]|uniref:23S rRNA (Guanosine(2251)-2'-O)-methyltransferase RlmB n=1 Tax=Candidatus Pantoea edessiphila TaxID=2044610 RepID=A0A2P5SZQ4_9GAMM|nr:23S rRNA (guanosine(2251)-2'-O)-methyltransferase RlmB [Candidatus Pantoea edessiphila]PPI87815.1 23S rRNA (guanosine(2251)-2'-O)-methyltransferase RlmB [Candidatus Pantoea edessiphila]
MNNIIFGINTVQTIQNTNPNSLKEVFIIKDNRRNDRLNLLYISLKKQGIKINLIDRQLIDLKVRKGVNHQGVVAIIRSFNQHNENVLEKFLKNIKKPLLLVLDCITDPHNLGACIRTADAAGVNAIIVPKNRSASLNETVQKVASGASVNVPLIRVTNLARTLYFLQQKNILIVGTSSKSEYNLYTRKLVLPIALVMGSESTGIRYLTRKCCDELISIPMHGIIPSLNISVATGICLFEILRQQKEVTS